MATVRPLLGQCPTETFYQMRPPVTMPGYHTGREPANEGKKYPAEILSPPVRWH